VRTALFCVVTQRVVVISLISKKLPLLIAVKPRRVQLSATLQQKPEITQSILSFLLFFCCTLCISHIRWRPTYWHKEDQVLWLLIKH